MKTCSLRFTLLSILLPLAAAAQMNSAPATTTPAEIPASSIAYAPTLNDLEFTLGGSGSSNTDFDSSLGGLSFSVGKYFSDTLLGSVRQSVNYSNPNVGSDSWSGSTFFALDQHFGTGALRPLLGINVGRIYGDNVQDTWAAGLETGVKYYVQPRTFIYVIAQYAWLFEDGNEIDDTFDDGQILWSAGVGFNF